jgi:hypothetical protein
VFTAPQGLTPEPTRNPSGEPGGSWWYDASTGVTLNAQPVASFVFSRWDIDGVYQGLSVNPITVTMNAPHTATAHYTPTALSVIITPPSAVITLSHSVTFAASPNGGTPPYVHYQWYLNGNPVPGATSATWVFTPTATGVYYVYVSVTDSLGATAQSLSSQVTVLGPPVGGYSVSLAKPTLRVQYIGFTALFALFAAILTVFRRKRK